MAAETVDNHSILEGDEEEDVLQVPLDDSDLPEDAEAPFTYDEDLPNLCDAFMAHPKGRDAIKTIGNEVIDLFDNEWEATGEYRERMAADLKILACDLPKKSFPYENAANCSVPIMLENVTRLAFRTYAELFGDWSNVCVFTGMGPEDDVEAEVRTLHTNWQIREQISDFRRQMHRALLIFYAVGDLTAHSYYDDFTGLNRHEMLTPAEFVTPYTWTSTQPDYSDVPWKAKILLRYRHELQRLKGKWYGVDELLSEKPPEWESDPESPLPEEINRMQGRDTSDDDPKAPYKLIWWEGWLELPNQAEDRYCQVIVEHRTRKVLKLSIHEMPDWQDKIRFEREQAELEEYRAAHAEFTAAMEAHQRQVENARLQLSSLSASGAIGPMAEMTESSVVDQMEATPPPIQEPMPPSWVEEGSDPHDPMLAPKAPIKRPIHLFAHGVCIEPLVGNLGLSYGRIEADFNRAANTALSQFTDAATLANVWSIITPDGIKWEKPFSIAPGKVNVARNVTPEELRNGIIELKPAAANSQLLEVVDKMYGYGQTAMQAPSVLSGEPGKSGETYRGLAARIEQATKQLSVAAGKFKDFLEQVIRNNCLLNSIFLKDEEIIGITDTVARRFREIPISRRIYERNYRVEVKADLRFTSMAQRVAEADEIVQMGLNDPLLANHMPFRLESIKQALMARGRMDLVEMLPTPEDLMMQQQQAAMAQQQQAAAQGGAPQQEPVSQEMAAE